MSRCNESKVTSAGSFFNFAGFADHAGQCCSQTLLNKTCCVLFCVLSRRDISHRSFDGDAWIVYRQQRMNVGAKDSPKWEPEQLIAFQSGFRTTVALNQPVHRTIDLFNVSQPFSNKLFSHMILWSSDWLESKTKSVFLPSFCWYSVGTDRSPQDGTQILATTICCGIGRPCGPLRWLCLFFLPQLKHDRRPLFSKNID